MFINLLYNIPEITMEIAALGYNKIKIVGANLLPEISANKQKTKIENTTANPLAAFFQEFHKFFQTISVNLLGKDKIYNLMIELVNKQEEFTKLKINQFMNVDRFAEAKTLAIEITEEISFLTISYLNKN